jgi:hypothetical protein
MGKKKEMKNRRKTASSIIERRCGRSEENSSLISRHGAKGCASKRDG